MIPILLTSCSSDRDPKQPVNPQSSKLSELRISAYRASLTHQYSLSESLYQKSLDCLQQSKQSREYAKTAHDITNVFRSDLKFKNAEAAATQAVETYEILLQNAVARNSGQESLTIPLTNAYLQLADCYSSAGNGERARVFKQKAALIQQQYTTPAANPNSGSTKIPTTTTSSNLAVEELFPQPSQAYLMQTLRAAHKKESSGSWLEATNSLEGGATALQSSKDRVELLHGAILLDEAAHIAWLHADHPELSRLAQECAPIQSNILWDSHPSALRTRCLLAYAKLAEGDSAAAAALTKKDYDRFGPLLPAPSKPDLIDCLTNLANSELSQNKAYAAQVLEDTWNIAIKRPSASPDKLSLICVMLGDATIFLADKKTARHWYEQGLCSLSRDQKRFPGLYAHILLRLASVEFLQLEMEAAKKHLNRALPTLISTKQAGDVKISEKLLNDIRQWQEGNTSK